MGTNAAHRAAVTRDDRRPALLWRRRGNPGSSLLSLVSAFGAAIAAKPPLGRETVHGNSLTGKSESGGTEGYHSDPHPARANGSQQFLR